MGINWALRPLLQWIAFLALQATEELLTYAGAALELTDNQFIATFRTVLLTIGYRSYRRCFMRRDGYLIYSRSDRQNSLACRIACATPKLISRVASLSSHTLFHFRTAFLGSLG